MEAASGSGRLKALACGSRSRNGWRRHRKSVNNIQNVTSYEGEEMLPKAGLKFVMPQELSC